MQTSIAQGMILAAGFGTRMLHLTADRPKAMVEVAGRTLIDHIIDRCKAAGVTRLVVNLHYQAEVLEAHLGDRDDVEIIFLMSASRFLKPVAALSTPCRIFQINPFSPSIVMLYGSRLRSIT